MSYDQCTWENCIGYAIYSWRRVKKPNEFAKLCEEHNKRLEESMQDPDFMERVWEKAIYDRAYLKNHDENDGRWITNKWWSPEDDLRK